MVSRDLLVALLANSYVLKLKVYNLNCNLLIIVLTAGEMTTETLQPENNILNVHSNIAAHAKYPLSGK